AGEDIKPSSYDFPYSERAHEQTNQELQRLTAQLRNMQAQDNFPKVSIEKGLCDRCPFNVRCDRKPSPTHPVALQAQDPNQLLKAASQYTADTVEEVSL
ncbi:MAG: hypothetical protein AAFU53_19445, partial [Cyanobacteria bacterium J06632_3]